LITENEIVAIRVAGISLTRILGFLAVIGVIFSLFLFIVNDKYIPSSHYSYRSKIKSLYAKNANAFIEPGVFIEHFKDAIIYVGDVQTNNKLKNIFIYEPTGKGTNSVIFAKQGKFTVDEDVLIMQLEDGFHDRVDPDGTRELYRLNFRILTQRYSIKEKDDGPLEKKPVDMSLDEIREKIRYLKEEKNIDPVKLVKLPIEFHKRISFAFSPLIFTLLGFGISLVVKHREKSLNFGIALLLGGMYYLLFILGETLSNYGYVSAALGMWLPNIAIGSIAAYLIYRNAYPR